jgi:hypothetical protein
VTYREEAAALDAEILRCMEARRVPDFGNLALRIFAHQLRYNEPYAKYCASLGVTLESMPGSWEAIPPVPAPAFKEAALCTFDPAKAALVFETSGTTQGVGGKHYMETAQLYDAALLSGFREGVLFNTNRRLRYLLLVPDPRERPHSSLGYMMQKAAQEYGDRRDTWLLHGDRLDVEALISSVRDSRRDGMPLCIAGTAFAFVNLLDELKTRAILSLPLASGSRVMETGGFKGRTRIVQRSELYAQLAQIFSLPKEHIIAEYGMTELTSQYYDAVRTAQGAIVEPRVKYAPPWLRPRVVGPDGKTLPRGTVGALVHVDLANRSSCIAIQTEDLGVESAGGIVLIGREAGAGLRGCSLDAEELRTYAAR